MKNIPSGKEITLHFRYLRHQASERPFSRGGASWNGSGGGPARHMSGIFSVFDHDAVALCLLTLPGSRHGHIADCYCQVAGTVSDRGQSIMRIQSLQIGQHRQPGGEERGCCHKQDYLHFPVARPVSAIPVVW